MFDVGRQEPTRDNQQLQTSLSISINSAGGDDKELLFCGSSEVVVTFNCSRTPQDVRITLLQANEFTAAIRGSSPTSLALLLNKPVSIRDIGHCDEYGINSTGVIIFNFQRIGPGKKPLKGQLKFMLASRTQKKVETIVDFRILKKPNFKKRKFRRTILCE